MSKKSDVFTNRSFRSFLYRSFNTWQDLLPRMLWLTNLHRINRINKIFVGDVISRQKIHNFRLS